MQLDIRSALRIGRFADAAYAPSEPPITFPIPFNYQLVQVVYGNDLATDIGGPKSIVPFGFIAQAPAPTNDFIVSIRGTHGIWEWIQDARFLRIACPFAEGAGETEDGFTDVYMSLVVRSPAGSEIRLVDRLRQLLHTSSTTTLTITGHSLGGSLATLLALDVVENGAFADPAVITFASPFVGDAQFARVYDAEVPNTWRIANVVDIIPKLPPPQWGFDHVNELFSLNSFGKAKLFPVCTHALTTYLYLLDQLNGGHTFVLDPSCAGPF
jgi:pimeloyl-ACP methyl ester carboxylesterase